MYEFTHFDLHTDNVMIREVKNYSYSVPFSNFMININNIDKIPVIIDYGMSSVTSYSYTIGSYNYKEHNVLNYMIPGCDMYRILATSLANSVQYQELATHILGLFSYFGNDDPYNILADPIPNLNIAINEFFKKIPVSAIAPQTPMMMLLSIIKKYSKILGPYVTITERNVYKNLTYTTVAKEYNNFLN